MPHEGESASYGPLRRAASNPRVLDFAQRCTIAPTFTAPPAIQPAPVRPSGWTPRLIYSIDGSNVEQAIETGYPGAELSVLTAASVVLDVELLRKLDDARPIPPGDYSRTQKTASVECLLPGANVVFRTDADAAVSLRRAVYEAMDATRLAPHAESLLDTYEVLLARKPAPKQPTCPYAICAGSGAYTRGRGAYTCGCANAFPMFSPDALRFHEGMNPAGPNGAMFAEVRQVLEHLILVNTLRFLEKQQKLWMLASMALVMDGPLAVFGHPAWLAHAIQEELRRLNEEVRRATGRAAGSPRDMLLLGVEKTGVFVDHFAMLDRVPGGGERFSSQTTLLIDNDYIRQHIVFGTSATAKPYGADTYYGRKFFYKTQSGARLVVCTPFLTDDHADTTTARPDQFPRLGDALSLLDQVVSSRYPNAVSPLVLAHQEAAIPLHLGQQVLQQLADAHIL